MLHSLAGSAAAVGIAPASSLAATASGLAAADLEAASGAGGPRSAAESIAMLRGSASQKMTFVESGHDARHMDMHQPMQDDTIICCC